MFTFEKKNQKMFLIDFNIDLKEEADLMIRSILITFYYMLLLIQSCPDFFRSYFETFR